MCGISGIWNLNSSPLNPDDLLVFSNSLSHRGPDGEGTYQDEQVPLGLGHRRLSIIDISDRGRQPMSFGQGRYWISYNGEVYNFIELRKELEGYGISFQSNSDTEVILAAYHRWGKDCLKKFNGMWAFAIWDGSNKELFLARDRFGIKPLYYVHIPGVLFAFASETVAFKHLRGYVREINPDKLTAVIRDSFCLEGFGHTIFKNEFQLLPGHYMVIGCNTSIRQRRWWNTVDHLQKPSGSYEDQVLEFKELFRDSCSLRLRSDVPVATALSGGLDSSAVYCTIHDMLQHSPAMARVPLNWQQAFSISFENTDFDEAMYAKQVTDHFGGTCTFIKPNYRDLPDQITQTTKKFDNVYFSPLIAGSEVYRAMSGNNIKVSLDGHGADEMLFGYPGLVMSAYKLYQERNDFANSEDLAAIYTSMFQDPISSAGHLSPTDEPNRREIFSNSLYSFARKYYAASRKLLGFPIPRVNYAWLHYKGVISLDELSDVKEDLQSFNEAEKLLYTNFHHTTLPTILRNFDRASMMHGVEVRMPFMDWRLVSFVFSLPLHSKIGGGFTKRILRDSMKGTMPESIRLRKMKIGLNAPLVDWFDGPLKSFLLDELSSRTFQSSAVWDGRSVKQFAEEKFKSSSWRWEDCIRIWPIINAHILLKG